MDQFLHLFKMAANACGTTTGFLPSLYDGLCGTDAQGVPTVQISTMQDILKLVGNVVRILIALSGGIAVIVIIVAAIFYVTSAGDPGRIKRAKDILMNTTIGLVLISAAYAIVTFIAGNF